VLDGWNILKSVAKNIFLMGLSTGGALAFYHASSLPVQGVVSLSTPFQLGPDPRLPILPLLVKVLPYLPKGGADWGDPNAGIDRFSYAKYPTKGLLELNRLLKVMRSSLPNVTAPVLLLHSKRDGVFEPINMDQIYQALGTKEIKKTKILLEKSGHVITKDLENKVVFNSVVNFIQKTLAPEK
jgi:carboxylesterase